MKQEKIFIFVVLFFSSLILLPLGAQEFGIAVQDNINAVLLNPAAMGVGNSQGLGYINKFSTEEGFVQDYDIVFSLGNLAYSYGNEYGDNKNLIAGGAKLLPGFYGGMSYQWHSMTDNLGGFSLSTLIRPAKFLSLAIEGKDLNKNAYARLGFGLRPLAFSESWGNRLTLSGDAKITDGDFIGSSLGFFTEPTDGVKIFGEYQFEQETFNIGVNLSFSYLDIGSSIDASGDKAGKEGTFFFNTSVKKQRSFVSHGFNKAIDYDQAELILDAPKFGYNIIYPQKGVRTLLDFILDMKKIEKDTTVEALIFRNQGFQTSFANMVEIENVLKDVKKSGKEIIFYYDSIDNLPYALVASVADQIYLNPAGSVNLKGFGMTNYYLKDFFDDWGIKVHNFQSHKYKTVYNKFSESSMTDAEREELETLYKGLHKQLLQMISDGRGNKLTLSAQQAIDEGPFIYAKKAKDLGLVDQLVYEDEFNQKIHERGYQIFPSRTTGDINYDWDDPSSHKIAVIYAVGDISMGEGTEGKSIGSETLAASIRAARLSPMVKGIILRVNSGGGSSLASDLIAREVALCRTGPHPKPVVVSMGGAAASGGYYISAAATKILASPGTITGSIGVITIMPEISGLLEKLKIGTGTVTTAKGADAGNPLTSLSERDQKKIKEFVAENYDQFISFVAANRDMPKEEVHKSAQGRVWTGDQAIERGLVDAKGGLKDAFTLIEQIANEGKELRIVEINPGKMLDSWNDIVPKSVKMESKLPEDLLGLIDMYERLSSFNEGEALYLMPYSVEELGVQN